MKKKNSLRYVIRSAVFIALVVCLLISFTYIFRDKNEAYVVKPYFDEPKNSLDIVFIGSSHLMCGIMPMELYDDFGYTSYVFATSSQLLPQSYHQLRIALNSQDPKLVVLDVGGVIYDQLIGANTYAHVQTDNVPWSLNKVEMTMDLFPAEERLPYFLNLIQFHTRWKSLTESDLRPIRSVTKGSVINFGMKELLFPDIPASDDSLPIPENANTYLHKIFDLCRDRGIEILLVNMPGLHSEDDYRVINSVYKIAEENGLRFLNYMDLMESLGIDPLSDFRDDFHLNSYGAYKTTRYLGSYLDEYFEISKDRKAEINDKWDRELEEYREKYPKENFSRG